MQRSEIREPRFKQSSRIPAFGLHPGYIFELIGIGHAIQISTNPPIPWNFSVNWHSDGLSANIENN